MYSYFDIKLAIDIFNLLATNNKLNFDDVEFAESIAKEFKRHHNKEVRNVAASLAITLEL